MSWVNLRPMAGPHAAAPEPVQEPQARPTPLPEVVRSGGGILNGLKRRLRPQPAVVQVHPFKTVIDVKPMPTRARISTDKLREPDPQAKTPSGVATKLKSTAKAFLGHSAPASRTAVANDESLMSNPVAAERALQQLFNASDAAAQLATRLMQFADNDSELPFSQPLSIGRTLAPLVANDPVRAMAALDVLSGLERPDAARADAFALQRSLATSTVGFEALQALQPDLRNPADDVLTARIRKDASMLALKAADALVRRQPPGSPAPISLGHVLAMPAHRGDQLAVKALACAAQLAHDPDAMPEVPLREAYFNWRSEYAAEGRGSDLEKSKARLFKLNTYGQRAASTEAKPFIQRVLGRGKSPLSALQMGSAGARLRNPADDFKRFDAVDTFVQSMKEEINTLAQQPGNPDARGAAIRKAVRAATAWRYKESIGKKGWRDEVNVGSTMRQHILQDALEMLRALPAVTKEDIRHSADYLGLKDAKKYLGLKKTGTIDTGKLETWAREELLGGKTDAEFHEDLQFIAQTQKRLDDALALAEPAEAADLEPVRNELERMRDRLKPVADIYRLRELNNNGDVPLPENATSQDVLGLLRDVMANARPTFDVRYNDGGIHGLNANIAEAIEDAASLLAIPVAVVAPSAQLIRGRQAVVNVGSAAMGGTLFVGTDTRSATQAGISGVASWALPKKFVAFSAGLQVTPVNHTTSSPKGVMIRTRMQPTGPAQPAPPGAPDWFALDKLLGVYDSITKADAAGNHPANKDAMWTAMASQYFKDPDVSVTWLDTKASSTSSSSTGSIGAYASAGGWRAGPMGAAGVSLNWANKQHRKDKNGSMPVDTIAHSSGRSAAVSGSVVAAPQALAAFKSDPGEVSQVSLPSVPLVGATIPLLGASTGVTMRMSRDGDRIIPDVTYRDMEFTRMKDYKQHVDARNEAWAASCSASGTSGQQVLNSFMTTVEKDADRGNQIFVERQSMKAQAARTLDAIIEAQKRLVPEGRRPNEAERTALAALDAKANSVMQDPESWRNRFLYVMETDTTQHVVGNSYLLQAQTQTGVTHLHMTAALKANQ